MISDARHFVDKVGALLEGRAVLFDRFLEQYEAIGLLSVKRIVCALPLRGSVKIKAAKKLRLCVRICCQGGIEGCKSLRTRRFYLASLFLKKPDLDLTKLKILDIGRE
jgi:hypothetical protein